MTAIVGPYNTAPNPANVMLGRGMLYLDNFDAAGNRTGQQAIGNVTTFDTENKVEVKEKYESMDPASSLYQRAVTRQTVMLKITGDEYTLDNLARAVLSQQPDIRVLLVSGYGKSAEIGDTIPGARLLGKPLDISQLRHELAEWLDHTEAAS